MKQINLTLFFIAFVFAGQAQMKSFIDQPYVEVAGNADTLVTPDEIFIAININLLQMHRWSFRRQLSWSTC